MTCTPAFRPAALMAVTALTLTACGGGGGGGADPGASQEQRINAAMATAQSNPQCAITDIGPFYWEVGDRDGVRASGSVGADAPAAGTTMPIYSASKWLYAAWVAQERGLRNDDVPYLNFTSGYTRFGPLLCPLADTVADCGLSTEQDPDTIGHYVYESGHMQVHAQNVMGLGNADNAALAAGLTAALGIDGLGYSMPMLAGGVVTTPSIYGRFLRKVLRGELVIADGLGAHKVCADPDRCSNADEAPDAGGETWYYSLGHWVEDDSEVGDHAYSSAGGGGFYPWISQDRSLYGIVARVSGEGDSPGYQSAQCGRLIRQAWVTGQTVSGTVPTP